MKFQTKFEDQITLILWKIIGYEYLYSVAIIKKEKKEKKKGIWLYGYDKFSPYVHRETMTTFIVTCDWHVILIIFQPVYVLI